MEFAPVIEDVEKAFLELRQSAKIVFSHFAKTYDDKRRLINVYKGNYCFPFFETGSYYYDGPDSPYCGDHHCFMPRNPDTEMRRFIEALRNLDNKVRPLFSWNIRTGKDWGDEGNLVFGDVRGWCYQGHGVSTRKFHGHAALVGAIIRGVYKDAFLAELIALAKEKGKPLNKNDFMSIQAFSR